MIEKAKIDVIIQQHADTFLNKTSYFIEPSPHRQIRKDIPAFSILEPADAIFYEYKYFEKSLENDIREVLVNPIIHDLFKDLGTEVIFPKPRPARSTNTAHEKACHFEFIIPSEKTGYRYTMVDVEDIEKLQKEYKITNIAIIDWNNHPNHNSDHKSLVFYTFEGFLSRYINQDIAQYIIFRLRQIVQEANEQIGFRSISSFSLRYISSFRYEVENHLSSNNFSDPQYKPLDNNLQSIHSLGSFSDNDLNILKTNFFENKLYKSLVGNKDFAKSFVTAEYLYYIFESNAYFEYTPIVTGYLKAVEQLIYCLIKAKLSNIDADSVLNVERSKSLWIKANTKLRRNKKHKMPVPDEHYWEKADLKSKPNQKQIRFVPAYEKYFDISLKPLINAMYDNDLFILSSEGNTRAWSILLKYCQECRNDHLHKDNIDSFKIVELIRNNTYLVMLLLLGGSYICSSTLNVYDVLGIVDDDYTKFYKKIIEIPASVKLVFIFNNNQEFIVRRIKSTKRIKYDENGLLNKNTLEFMLVNNSSIKSKPDIIISADNMPHKAWYEKADGQRIEIQWD